MTVMAKIFSFDYGTPTELDRKPVESTRELEKDASSVQSLALAIYEKGLPTLGLGIATFRGNDGRLIYSSLHNFACFPGSIAGVAKSVCVILGYR